MSQPLAGRVVLITGASAGIGRATAERLLRSGCVVIGCARTPERNEQVRQLLPGLDLLDADIRLAADRARLVEHVLRRHGRLDVLVNNAGVGHVGLLTDLDVDDLEDMVATNVVALADLTRRVLPHMLARGSGDVVMLSSTGAWVSLPPIAFYCACKAAVDRIVEGLRRELRGSGVRVHSINPGPMATEYLSTAGYRRPREGDGDVPPFYAPARVAQAVELVLGAGRPRTLAVPRSWGIVRLAQLPPVGALLNVVLGTLAGKLAEFGREQVRRRQHGWQMQAGASTAISPPGQAGPPPGVATPPGS